MVAREERGLVIAATSKLVQKGNVWLVPSQNGKGKYTVSPDENCCYCSCPDHEETGEPCKHVFAVRTVIKRETSKNGTVTDTRSITFTEKKTYRKPSQPVWDMAQQEEKRRFVALLADLCSKVKNPPKSKPGRTRTPLADMIFASVYKVYSTVSARRFQTDLDEAAANGHLFKKLNSIMVGAFLENPMLTPVLKALVTASARPLAVVEDVFAVDSTGFSTSRFTKWFDEKYNVNRIKADWMKCHALVGTRTHCVVAVEVLEKDSADSPQFKGLVETAAKSFRIREVSADKAYLSLENMEAVVNVGGTPFIAFKANSTGGKGGIFEKMFHLYSMNRDAYMERYHCRSNAESVFSMCKAKLGDAIRSRTDVAMTNEVLCKLIAHNLCCLIMSQVELGIDPVFESVPAEAPKPAPVAVAADFDLSDFRFSD
jgi:transposase